MEKRTGSNLGATVLPTNAMKEKVEMTRKELITELYSDCELTMSCLEKYPCFA